MNRDTLIHIFATAMAFASSGMVLASTNGFVAPHLTTVQIGSELTIGGALQVGCLNPSTQHASAVLHSLSRRVFELEPNDRLRPVTKLMLVDGGLGVDLVKLAQVLPVDTRVQVTGKFDRTVPAKVASKMPLNTTDTLRVNALLIDGTPIVKPTAAEARRIEKVATQLLLRYIRELNPHMADGPEAVVDAVEVVSSDHAVLNVHFVSGWTHQPIEGMTARVLVVLSGDDEVHVLEGQLQ